VLFRSLNNDTDTILIQKLLHRALDELTLVETTKSADSQANRISTCSIPTSLSPKARKKLHATQRHLKLLCTIAIFSLVQLDQNLERAMELLDQLEGSVYSLEIDGDNEKRRKNTAINQKFTVLPIFQILPGYACYMALVTGWTKQLQQTTASPAIARRYAEKAQEVLYKMIARALSSTNFLLTRQSFNVVLNAWAELGCGNEARALLNQMNELPSNIGAESEEHEIVKKSESSSSTTSSQSSQLPSSIRPDLFSYNTVLKAYAKEQTILRSYRNKLGIQRHQRGNRNDDEEEATPSPCSLAEQLLKQIEEGRTATHGGMPIFPDRISYTSVIDAFAASNKRDAAFKAEALLNRMEQLYRETGNESIKPDTIAYNNVLNAFSKYSEQQTGQSGSMNKDSSMDNLGERCEKLLQRMERLYIEGENPDVRPDTYSYNSVINTWANTAHCDSARRALNLLDEMERLSLSGEERVTPNTISYNTAIKAWGRNADATAPQLVDDLLQEMEERYESGDVSCKPDRVTYNSVMFSWANSADVHAAGKVEELLNRMISLYKQHGDITVKPDVTSYNILLNCWAKTRAYGASELACELLGRMIHLSNIGDPDAVSPDTRSYVAVMNCISKSSDPGKALKALDVLNSLESSFKNGNSAAIPNVFAYSIVLNACAFTTGDEIERKQAMDIAIETLSRVSKSRTAKPNHVIYGSFLKACAMLMPMEDPRKRQMITDVFSKCCRDGQVGSNVLEQLKFAAPPDLYDSLVGHYMVNGQIGLQSIPSSWRCNVRENKFHSPKRKLS